MCIERGAADAVEPLDLSARGTIQALQGGIMRSGPQKILGKKYLYKVIENPQWEEA